MGILTATCLMFSAWRTNWELLLDFHLLNKHLLKDGNAKLSSGFSRLFIASRLLNHHFTCLKTFLKICFVKSSASLDVADLAPGLKAFCSIIAMLLIVFPVYSKYMFCRDNLAVLVHKKVKFHSLYWYKNIFKHSLWMWKLWFTPLHAIYNIFTSMVSCGVDTFF